MDDWKRFLGDLWPYIGDQIFVKSLLLIFFLFNASITGIVSCFVFWYRHELPLVSNLYVVGSCLLLQIPFTIFICVVVAIKSMYIESAKKLDVFENKSKRRKVDLSKWGSPRN